MASHLCLPCFQLFQNRRALGLVGIHSGCSSWPVSDGSILHRHILAIRRSVNPTVYKAYHCTGTGNQFRAPHNGFTINAVILEDAVLQQINLQIQRAIDIESFLKRMSMQDVAKQLKMQRQAEIGVLRAKAADLKKRRSKAFEDLSDAMIDKEVYRAQMLQADKNREKS